MVRVALRPRYPKGNNRKTFWIGDYVYLEESPDAVTKTKISAVEENRKSVFRSLSPQLSQNEQSLISPALSSLCNISIRSLLLVIISKNLTPTSFSNTPTVSY
jgi:hypothetical protein